VLALKDYQQVHRTEDKFVDGCFLFKAEER